PERSGRTGLEANLALDRRAFVRSVGPEIDDERGWRGEPLQGLAPERFCQRSVLAFEPGDMFAIPWRQRPFRITSLREGLVQTEDLPQDQKRRSPIRQKMVDRPHALVVGFPQSEQGPACQRRFRQREPSFPIRFQVSLQSTLLLG